MDWRKFLNIGNKVFDSLPDDEKKQVFLDKIEDIENNDDFKKLKKYRDRLDENQKLKYYRDWDVIRLIWSVKHTTKLWKPINVFHIKEEAKDRAYEVASPLIRIWVSFWLLDAPKKIDEKELLRNIKGDATSLRRNLWIFEKVCTVVPQLKVAFPIVKAIRPYAKWYEKNGVSLMQERIRDKNIEKTKNDLADVLSNSQKNG